MSGIPRKKPLVIIGLVLFGVIAAVGIIIDFVKKSEGLIAIPAVGVAFLVLGIFLGIEELLRRRNQKPVDDFDDQFELDSDRQFIRHTNPQDDFFEDDDSASDSSESYYDDVDDDLDEPQPSASLEQEQPENFGSLFQRRRKLAEDPDTTVQPESVFEPDDEPAFEDEPEIEDEPEYLKPVMVLGSREPEVEAPPSEPEPYFDDEQKSYFDEPAPEPVPEPKPVSVAAPKPAPKQQATPAPVPAAAVVPAEVSAMGQSLESFYADMSDEDILFRDCVEVWAADAKPCMLRLLKYVESIEDKQTQAAFGRECEYINAMLDRISFFNQLEYIDQELEPTRCNFSSMVKECLKRFSPFFMEKRLGLLWKGLDVEAMIDRKWFIFALTQIIFNSVEFTPQGGKIAISAKKNGSFIDLSVDDSGCGISPEEMPYVLMAGFMGDDAQNESGRRTGMGLFIARSVAIKMGGDLYVESNYGKGTRVTLHLPTGL